MAEVNSENRSQIISFINSTKDSIHHTIHEEKPIGKRLEDKKDSIKISFITKAHDSSKSRNTLQL